MKPEEMQQPDESLLEAILENQDSNAKSNDSLLEAILENQDSNAKSIEPLLEAQLVKTDELVKAVKDKPEVQKVQILGLENLQGKEGPQGEKGDKGDVGPEGPTGSVDIKADGEVVKKADTIIINGFAGKDGRDGKDGKDGKDGLDGKNGKNGKDGKDGSPDTAKDIKNKLESLEGDERLDVSAIKGLKAIEKKVKDTESNLLWVNNGAVKSVTAGTNVTIDNTDPQNPIISSTSGSVSPLTTKGDLYTYSTTDARLGVGTDGQALIADSSTATGIKWATLPGGGDALTTSPLSQFAATTSAQLAGVISDETGTGALVFANSPTLVTPALGTPSSVTLTNATGLPISTGVSGLGTGIATFLATPSSANLISAVTDETGTGVLVFNTAPTFATSITTPSVLATANDSGALGASGTAFSDLFLASGGVINWNSGDVTLTHSANTLTLAGGSLVLPDAGLTVGASIPFSDSAGTLTLQNIDALDATTEATIEGAIDTLANLTSIQGRTVTLADAGADAIFGWDDSASAYQNLSAADALVALGVTSSAAELNILDGATLSTTELNYVDGVTSAIQTQLDGKQASDAQLTSLAGLSYTGNAGKFIRVNAGETDFELATVSGSGTVTSVAMTVPTGLTVTGSPITTAGTLAVALDTGYVIPLQTTLDAKAPLASPTFTGEVTIPNTGLHILDTNATHDLIISPGSNLTADRTLTLTTGDTNMIVDFTAVTDEYVLAYDAGTNTWRGVAGGAGGGISRSINNITGTTSAGSTANTDYVYNATSGTFTITLPTAVSNTNLYVIKNSGTGIVTIATTSSQTIDGETTWVIPTRYASVSLVSDGSNWIIIS